MNRGLEGFVGCSDGSLGLEGEFRLSRDVSADVNFARVGRVGSVSTRREDKKNCIRVVVVAFCLVEDLVDAAACFACGKIG